MLHYISFGSGSSGNCSYLYTEKGGILIDVGVRLRVLKKYFKNYGLHMSDIKYILVTHDHADHVRSVGSVSMEYGLPVYTTEKVHRGIEANWSVRYKVPADRVKVIAKDEPFMLDDIKITPFEVPHDSSDNVGYCIEHEGMTFVLMTDIGHLTPDITGYISKANYLVIEADYETEMLEHGPYPAHLKTRISGPLGHMSNQECGQALATYATPSLRHMWLCHLSNENNHPDLAEKTVKQILQAHGIIAGSAPGADFKLEVLKRKTPSEIYELI